MGWILFGVQIVGLVVLGFFLRGFVLNQAAYIQIHVQNILRKDYVPRPEMLERFERIEKRYDPLAERVAVIESRIEPGP